MALTSKDQQLKHPTGGGNPPDAHVDILGLRPSNTTTTNEPPAFVDDIVSAVYNRLMVVVEFQSLIVDSTDKL